MKKENSFQGGVSRINWKGAHREIELQGRLQREMNRVKVLWEGERVHSSKARDGPSYVSKITNGPGERGQEIKASRHGTTKERINVVIQNLKVFC